ncbi:tripartite tricarboxylate transporter substrate-binding protein [Leisingera sp. ANG-M1]|uniref:tripartite tricarboxylate transporter substrate-binding protein n=1 Tax=Leisingera sp. ANG-M1 TaxID=1577895 RepID=UPI00069055DE|nr:tripartite tricarboxylate transporter substrate-binding protein [Leisingera sp. ANG-M1]
MPELETLAGWTGVTGPKELPDGIAGKWARWVDTAITDPELTAQMRARGSKTVHMSQKESAAFIKDQYETFRTLIDKHGIRIEG